MVRFGGCFLILLIMSYIWRLGGGERVDYSFEVGDGVMLVLLKDVMGSKSGILRRIQGWIGETV